MNDAEERLAARLAEDLERVLRSGVLIGDLEVETEPRAAITVTCLLDGRAEQQRAEGADLVEAMAGVIRAAAELRLRGAFWQVVGPG